MLTFVFPGQGSQRVGMGGELFDQYPELVRQADAILGYSVAQLCLRDPHGVLNQTEFTQPAIYVVNALKYLHRIEGGGPTADFYAGHSLGEISALYAAGALDFATGLTMVRERARLMAQADGGGMLAVVGLDLARIQAVLGLHGLQQLDIANLNAPSQTVLAGPAGEIRRAAPLFEQAGAQTAVVLRVSGAFHSRYMSAAGAAFRRVLEPLRLQAPRKPVVANVNAELYSLDSIAELLTRQLVSPVLWSASVQRLMALPGISFEEIGEGRILTGLIERIRREAEPDYRPFAALGTLVAPPDARAIDDLPLAASSLGSSEFCRDHNVRFAYASGSMYKGIASAELVIRMAKAGLLAFFGAGGLQLAEIDSAIGKIRSALPEGAAYGVNVLHQPNDSAAEEALVELLLARHVRRVESSAFLQVTPALVRYRVAGLRHGGQGVVADNKLLAKLSHPEVARAFMSPPPAEILAQLVARGQVTPQQAEWARHVSMADDICVEADSGGHTDQGVLSVLLPAIAMLRDEVMRHYAYRRRLRVGAAGGIGTPQAVAAAFALGADFVMTGSINQCTVEAGTSEAVKDMLQEMGAQDTAMAPSGDMFELGASIQVLKRGVFFPARARKLYELYQRYESLEEIDEKSRQQIEQRYFQRSFEEVFAETRAYYERHRPEEIRKALSQPKHKMALVFKWYFVHSNRLARHGQLQHKVDFQIHCGPALGAFNQWTRGTELASWRSRHPDLIAERLMQAGALCLQQRYAELMEAAA